jgi:hypothetical protein
MSYAVSWTAATLSVWTITDYGNVSAATPVDASDCNTGTEFAVAIPLPPKDHNQRCGCVFGRPMGFRGSRPPYTAPGTGDVIAEGTLLGDRMGSGSSCVGSCSKAVNVPGSFVPVFIVSVVDCSGRICLLPHGNNNQLAWRGRAPSPATSSRSTA